MPINHIGIALLSALLWESAAFAVGNKTVPVGNANNPADVRYDVAGIGSVPYAYRIGATEVTNAEYVEFLNAVADLDQFALFNTSMQTDTRGGVVRAGVSGSFQYAVKPPVAGEGIDGIDYTYDNKPVVFVSWYDAIRFANWLHNDRGTGDTESGAYALLGGTPVPTNADGITRNVDASWWIPSEDEWYKAAYFDPDRSEYNQYPTEPVSPPDNNIPALDTGNAANFLEDMSGPSSAYTTGDSNYPMTDVGSYLLSSSPYGTFDQGGNVAEWNEKLVEVAPLLRGVRGGNWSFNVLGLAASTIGSGIPTNERASVGFRVATFVPEPSSVLVLSWSGLYLFLRQRRDCRERRT